MQINFSGRGTNVDGEFAVRDDPLLAWGVPTTNCSLLLVSLARIYTNY